MDARMLVLAGALALAGCGGEMPEEPTDELRGVRVTVNPRAEVPVELDEELLDETQRALEVAREVWGGGAPLLWTIELEGSWFPCQTGEGAVWTYGCTYPWERRTRVGPDDKGCRTGVLIHEVGHMRGVHDHADPRFAAADAARRRFCGE